MPCTYSVNSKHDVVQVPGIRVSMILCPNNNRVDQPDDADLVNKYLPYSETDSYCFSPFSTVSSPIDPQEGQCGIVPDVLGPSNHPEALYRYRHSVPLLPQVPARVGWTCVFSVLRTVFNLSRYIMESQGTIGQLLPLSKSSGIITMRTTYGTK